MIRTLALVAVLLLAPGASAWVPAPFFPDVNSDLYPSVASLVESWGEDGMATYEAFSMAQIFQSDTTNGTVLSTAGGTQWYKQYLPCTMFLSGSAGWARSGVPLSNTTDIPQLSDLLSYQIYPGDITLFNKRNVAMNMSNGQMAYFRSSGTRSNPVYTITDAMGNTVSVAKIGYRAGGCIVVKVKDVLMPNKTLHYKPAATATLEMAQDSNVGIFYGYCLRTGACNTTLNSTTDSYTVFAQVDSSAALWGGGNGVPIGPLTSTILEHIVPGKLYSSDITDGMVVTTLSGANLTFYTNLTHITLFAGGHWAVITKADIEAGPSLIHESDDDYDANYTALFWTEPTPCQWTSPWVNGSCAVSNDYLLAIPDDEIYSQFGLEHKHYQMKELQCNAQPTAEACALVPLCVWNFAGQCTRNTYRDDAGGACPNTQASRYFECRVNYVTAESCNANPNCAWNETLNNATAGPRGSPWTACFEKSLANMSVDQLNGFTYGVLYNMDPDVYKQVWGTCRPAQEWYAPVRVLVVCPQLSSADACRLEQCIWTGSSCVMDFSYFLGQLLIGAGRIQEQAMQCYNPFRSTLGQGACDSYQLIPSFYGAI